MPKFRQNSGKLCKKNIIKKIFSFFPELCTKPRSACKAYMGKLHDFTSNLSFEWFSAISAILLKTCLFSDLRRKTLKRMQTNQYEEIEYYQKDIFWVFFSLLPTKNAKMDEKHSILGNKRTIRETCIMSVL